MKRRAIDPSAVTTVSRRQALLSGAGVASLALLPAIITRTAVAATTSAFDFYISPSGSDSNPGTQGSPWAITSLKDTSPNNKLMAGKQIGLMSGTYDLGSMSSGSQPGDYQHPVLNIPAGSPGNPTVVQSVSARGAIFTFGGNGGVNSVIGQNPGGNGYFTLDGIVINGGGFNGSLISYFPGSNNAGITVQNCEIYGVAALTVGNNYAGMFLQGANGAVIQNNYFHDIHKPSQPDHCHGYEEYSCIGTQFLNNTIVNCDSGIDGKVGDAGAVIAYNYFYNCPIGAIQGYDGAEGNPNPPGTANTVHHNVFDSCGGQHVCDVNNTTSQGLVWYNNTAYDTRSGSITTLDLRTSSSKLVKCYNNICVMTSNGGGPYTGSIAQSSNGYTLLDYNNYFLNSYSAGWGLSGNATYSSLSAWQSASGADGHSMTSNPQFATSIKPGAGPAQFNLGSGSPCAGAGRVGGVASGAACDMGAWANGTTSIGCNFLSGAVPEAPTLKVS